jgi:hypothetical protein
MLSFENPNVMMAGRQGVDTITEDVFFSFVGHRAPVYLQALSPARRTEPEMLL